MFKTAPKQEIVNKPITERHIYTTEIVNVLMEVPEGETISYDELSKVIGMGVQPSHPGYGYQHSARKILERDENIVFEIVTKIGLKRLTPEEVAIGSHSVYVKSKKSLIRRSKRRIDTVNDAFDDLSPQGKLNTTMLRTILAFDSECSKHKNILKIEKAATNNNGKLIGFEDTINLFKK